MLVDMGLARYCQMLVDMGLARYCEMFVDMGLARYCEMFVDMGLARYCEMLVDFCQQEAIIFGTVLTNTDSRVHLPFHFIQKKITGWNNNHLYFFIRHIQSHTHIYLHL